MIPLHPSQLFCCLIPQKRTRTHKLTHPWGELTEWPNTFHNFSALQQICHLISHLPHDGIKTVQWKGLSLLLNNIFQEKHIARVLQNDGKHARMHQTDAGTRFRHKDYFPLIPAVTTRLILTYRMVSHGQIVWTALQALTLCQTPHCLHQHTTTSVLTITQCQR